MNRSWIDVYDRRTTVSRGMVFPGTGAHSPCVQSRTFGWAISSGVSCMSGEVTRSVTGSGQGGFRELAHLRRE